MAYSLSWLSVQTVYDAAMQLGATSMTPRRGELFRCSVQGVQVVGYINGASMVQSDRIGDAQRVTAAIRQQVEG